MFNFCTFYYYRVLRHYTVFFFSTHIRIIMCRKDGRFFLCRQITVPQTVITFECMLFSLLKEKERILWHYEDIPGAFKWFLFKQELLSEHTIWWVGRYLSLVPLLRLADGVKLARDIYIWKAKEKEHIIHQTNLPMLNF